VGLARKGVRGGSALRLQRAVANFFSFTGGAEGEIGQERCEEEEEELNNFPFRFLFFYNFLVGPLLKFGELRNGPGWFEGLGGLKPDHDLHASPVHVLR
jgi:hypothetical protein